MSPRSTEAASECIRCNKPKDDSAFGVQLILLEESKKVLVKRVDAGMLADQSGLNAGDFVLSVNGEAVTGAVQGTQLLKAAPAGVVEILVQRGPVELK